MYKIIVTNRITLETEEFFYKQKKIAFNRFKGRCVELGYKYTEIKAMDIFIAGDLNQDYKIELIKSE